MFAERMRGATRPGKGAILGSVLVHLVLAAGVLVAALRAPGEAIEYKVYRVDLYSPPPQIEGEPEAPKPQPAIVRPETPSEPTVREKAPAPAPSGSR